MMRPTTIDSAWLATHPLPVHGTDTTKHSRGHVVVIGGGRSVPGALRLSGEAVLRVGAGKLQLATVASVATLLGVSVPEAGVIELEETGRGEISHCRSPDLAGALSGCDAVVIGPGIWDSGSVGGLLDDVMASAPSTTLLVDAVAIAASPALRDEMVAYAGSLIFTPHYGEMAALLERDIRDVEADPAAAAARAAERFRATIVLKGSETVIATPGDDLLHYGGGGVGLATGGSGDVLAGAIAGLVSRGAEPLIAAAWGVWLHGQAARRLASDPGPIGFLAREIPAQFPHLLPQ
jgi:hydroxyethylthiazole kinase-like uncharacterized protein yjeF